MKFRNKLVVIIIGSLLFIGILFLVLHRSTSRSNPAAKPTESQISPSSGDVIIDNTDKLSALLLNEQYSAVYDALGIYIKTHVNKDITHAYLASDPIVLSDGTVSFAVKTDQPAKTFNVTLDRSSKLGDINLRIPETNYSQLLSPFGNSQTGD